MARGASTTVVVQFVVSEERVARALRDELPQRGTNHAFRHVLEALLTQELIDLGEVFTVVGTAPIVFSLFYVFETLCKVELICLFEIFVLAILLFSGLKVPVHGPIKELLYGAALEDASETPLVQPDLRHAKPIVICLVHKPVVCLFHATPLALERICPDKWKLGMHIFSRVVNPEVKVPKPGQVRLIRSGGCHVDARRIGVYRDSRLSVVLDDRHQRFPPPVMHIINHHDF